MPTYEEYVAAAKNADSAGDAASARVLLEKALVARAQATTPPPASDSVPRGQSEDIAKGAARGLMQGIEGTLGFPGYVQNLAEQGGQWVARQLGASPETIDQATEMSRGSIVNPVPFKLPSQGDISGARKDLVGDIAPPQTRAGEIAQTGGRYAINAAFPAKSGLQRALNVIAPAAGEEGGAEIARKVAPQYEDAARLGGSLFGSLASTPSGKTKAVDPDIRKKEATKLFRQAESAGVRASPRGTSKVLSSLRSVRRKQIDPRIDDHSNMNQRLASAEEMLIDPQTGVSKQIDFDTLRAARDKIANGYTVGKPDNNRIMMEAKDAFDEAVEKLTARDFIGPDKKVGPEAFAAWRDARKKWTQYRKADKMQDIHNNALNAVGANYTDAKYVTAVRQGLRGLAKDNFKRARFFTKDERNRILRVLRGAKEGGNLEDAQTLENALRAAGKTFGGKSFGGVIKTGMSGGLLMGAGVDPASAAAIAGGMNVMGNKAASMAEDIGTHKFNNLRNVVAGEHAQAYGTRRLPQAAAKALPYNYREK